MTRQPADLTRKWWYLFESFPAEHRDAEIAQWISERKVAALIALFEADKNEAIKELCALRRRYPKEYERARREHRGEYEWDEDIDDDDELSDRKWERREQERDRQEAQYEWVEREYERLLYVVQERSRLIGRITELDEVERSLGA